MLAGIIFSALVGFSSAHSEHTKVKNALHNESNCNGYSINSNVQNQIHELQDVLEWWGASSEQVASAPCRKNSAPNSLEMDELINKSKGEARVTQTVHGVRFENEPKELVEAFKQLTTRQSVYGSKFGVIEPQINIQSNYQVNPECKAVRCAIEKIWGTELAQKILFMKLKHGFNSSELAFDKSSRLTLAELDDLLITLEALPPNLHPLGRNSNQRMVPFIKGESLYDEQDRTLANSGIIFFDGWRKKDSLVRQYTTFHELSHNISVRLSNADTSEEWRALSGWKYLGGDGWEKNPEACFISKYGAHNAFEDFAEVVSAYRYNAKGLENSCPQKYQYMKKNVFAGKEYKDNSQCPEMNPTPVISLEEALTSHFKNNIYHLSSDLVALECREEFSSYPPNQKELENCAFKATLKVMPVDKTKELMKQTGLDISDSSIPGIAQVLGEKSTVRASLKNQVGHVDRALKSLIEQYQSEVSGVTLPPRQTEAWKKIERECGFVLIEMPQEAALCYIEALAIEDQSLKARGEGFAYLPRIFQEELKDSFKPQDRNELEESLHHDPRFLEQLSQTKIALSRDTLQALRSMKNTASLVDEWQTMSPDAFCSHYYSKGHALFTNWGLSADESVASIKDECMRLQQGAGPRRHPSNDEWKKWAEARWN